jgi:urea-proton symporter
MPYVLKSLLGRGATSGLLVLIFMAITSTVSSSMIAVSSIISLDFYRTYINPTASDKKTLQVSHIGVIFHGAFMAGFALMLNYAGATNNWSTYFRPIIACPGIFPMMLTILWSGQTKAAAIASPVLGLLSGLTTWFVLSWYWGGAINIQTTQQQLPGLYGAIVSFFSPALFSVAISLAKPSTFDWRIFLKLDLITEKSAQQSRSCCSPTKARLPNLSTRPNKIAADKRQYVYTIFIGVIICWSGHTSSRLGRQQAPSIVSLNVYLGGHDFVIKAVYSSNMFVRAPPGRSRSGG